MTKRNITKCHGVGNKACRICRRQDDNEPEVLSNPRESEGLFYCEHFIG
jgi:hypothetical protein